jgi:ATP-dependent Clp protease ATP-binding subunit ClpC
VIDLDFTPHAHQVLAAARQESLRLRHEYVGTEHLLLALLREHEGPVAEVLRGFDVEAVRRSIEEVVRPGHATARRPEQLPYTSRTLKALRLATQEAERSGEASASAAHLLIGLCAEERGIGAQALQVAGLTAAAARAAFARLAAQQPGTSFLNEGGRDV